MRKEAARRMKKLGIPDESIQEYLENGTPYCTGENGERVELDEEDLSNIKRVQTCECEVYFVNKRTLDGILMLSYMIVSEDEGDRAQEFYATACKDCYGAYAFVKSEVTRLTFDTGWVSLRTENGNVYRLSGTEVQAITDLERSFYNHESENTKN